MSPLVIGSTFTDLLGFWYLETPFNYPLDLVLWSFKWPSTKLLHHKSTWHMDDLDVLMCIGPLGPFYHWVLVYLLIGHVIPWIISFNNLNNMWMVRFCPCLKVHRLIWWRMSWHFLVVDPLDTWLVQILSCSSYWSLTCVLWSIGPLIPNLSTSKVYFHPYRLTPEVITTSHATSLPCHLPRYLPCQGTSSLGHLPC